MGLFGGGGASVDLASPPAIGNTTPNTGAFTTLSFAPAANTTGLSSSSYSLTGSNAQSLVSLTGTWNTTGTPSAILLNITNTASNSASRFLELQTDGTTRLRVRRDGAIFGRDAALGSDDGFSWGDQSGGAISFYSAGLETMRVTRNAAPPGIYFLRTTSALAFSEGHVFVSEGTDLLAQRRTTNAQTFRLYNTFTDASNYERGFMRWNANAFEIGTEKAGTGTLRGLKIGTATTSLIGFYGVTPVDQPATVADPAGGLTVDAEARTAINAIIDRLQELGLIA